jgi:hypothetical protein
MKARIAAVGRLFLIYGIPFLVISTADKLPAMVGYDVPIIVGGVAWMFGFHFLLNGKTRQDGQR